MQKKIAHTFYLLLLLGVNYSLFAETKSEPIILDVFANCADQVKLQTGKKLELHATARSSRSGTTNLAGYINFAGSTQHYPLNDYRFEFPQKNTFSLLFPGPVASAQYFCQESPRVRELIIRSRPSGNVRIALSRSGDFVRSPLGKNGEELQVSAGGTYGNIFRAGEGTSTPYWFQFLLSTHKNNSTEIEVQYEFH